MDSADFNTGTLTVSFTAGSDSAEDVLSIRNQGTGAGQIGVSGSNVTYNFGAGAVTIGSFAGGSSGSNLVITLNSSADATAVTALAKNITYENTDTAAPTTGARTVRFVLTDGDGGISANYDTTVTVSGVNDPPVITSNGGGATASINVAETVTAVTDVDATDPEAPPQSLTYSISGDDAGDFTINPTTGVLTFTTTPDFEAPADADGNNSYLVTVQVSDGNGGVDTQDLTITVTDVVNTLTVTTTSDADDTGLGASYTIEQLNALGAAVSLREAITAANSTAGTDTVAFNIAGAGPHTISLTSALPTITQTVIIDGTTEPDFGTTPIIELNGAGAGAVNGLVLGAGSGGSTIRGLVIQNFNQSGILVQSAGNTVAGNYIGLDADGTTLARNNTSNTVSLGGIRVESGTNTIGGLTAADRNVISGNLYSGIVLFGASANSNLVPATTSGPTPAARSIAGTIRKASISTGGSNNIIGGSKLECTQRDFR